MSEQAKFTTWPQVAFIEIDRFCDDCGYNLHQQPVRRHSDLGILLCRCPECGRIHAAADGATAGRPWLRRLSKFLLTFWVLLLIVLPLGLSVAQGAIMAATLDELTWYRPVDKQKSAYQMQVKPLNDEDELLVMAMRGASLACGLVVGMGVAVFCPHWRRPWYYVLAVMLPSLTGAVVYTFWRVIAADLAAWGAVHIWSQAGMNMLGGLLGVTVGRPAARLVVRVALPPWLRSVLSDLWLLDGLQPPRVSRTPRSPVTPHKNAV